MLTGRHIRVLAWLAAEEIARRQRFGIPVPQALRDVHTALTRELSQPRHDVCETPTDPARLVTAAELARQHGVSKRTVQRRARKQGVRPVAGRYLFQREESQ